MNETGNFWKDAEIISVYTRAQAIEDGVLVELDATAKEAGFKWPVAVTRTVYEVLEPSEALKAEGQSFAGRTWDMLTILRYQSLRASGKAVVAFAPFFVLEPGQAPRPVQLKAECGPGDHGEPVITIALPEED